jgi:NAD(P)H-hydrate epimerase
MKVFSTSQIRQLDQYTIEHEPVQSIWLMERACKAFTDWFINRFEDKSVKIKIFCGVGNNGGDGLGIARLLAERGYTVKIYIIQTSATATPDFEENKSRVLLTKVIKSTTDMPKITENDIVIDAIFGSGLNKAISDTVVAHVIEEINKSMAIRIAIDIASGLFADQHTASFYIIQPDYTVSFQFPKLAFLLPENEKYTGEWHLVNIGLHPEFIQNTPTSFYFTQETDIKTIFRKRNKFSHKGTFGHALLITGSYGKIGASVLASQACLRAGVGLLTVQIPSTGYLVLQTSVPEAMTITDSEKDIISQLIDIDKFSTIGIGPGLGTSIQTVEMFESLLRNVKKPLVIDADALNIISQRKSLLHLIPPGCIFTPHPKEFERLTGATGLNDFDRLKVLQDFSRQYQIVVVLKGHYSAIAMPNGEVHFNSTGNAGMATGGTGDVLTGILTSLLAQGYSSEEAAILGVYLHGKAGDLAAQEKGFAGMIASDIIHYLPQAIKYFE